MKYEESVRALMALGRELAAPQQARVQKFGLENISILVEALGNPHRAIPCAHIAGTNGKGSTAAMLDAVLRAAGLRTGLYTSPHLERINERIRINGEDISDDEFAAAWTRVQAAIEALLASGKLAAHPTYFECVTAMAFVAFAKSGVDFAIYEVGLGGRLDSTNVVQPEVAVITSIDFDHEDYLGHSIEEIASEKAGIIKPGAWVASTVERPEARAVIARRCQEMDARLVEIDTAWRMEEIHTSGGYYRAVVSPVHSHKTLAIEPPLPGRFQIRNALGAATAARLLGERGFPVDDAAIENGIRAARWAGRLERLGDHPAIYLDGTHNPSGARELLKFWEDNFKGRRIVLVYGAMRDKAVDEIAGLLFPAVDFVILTEPRQPRAISAPLLAEMTSHLAKRSTIVRDPGEALEEAIAMASPEDAVFATGSLYLVGDLRTYWHKRKPTEIRP
ncbi:MAG TPA: folylpolyglutamate synthase/dihydrofolate synthase family protein [Candidatus Acidoferrales bacterium]|jgi:dihydrofolate synthase/folylpolyglutamate synthase|nr:folylpolyglutamate synthase/dihydrofolate synthase family protein [Candidatus Acidoferrales bacterium]